MEEWAGGVRGKVEGKSGKRKKGTKEMEREREGEIEKKGKRERGREVSPRDRAFFKTRQSNKKGWRRGTGRSKERGWQRGEDRRSLRFSMFFVALSFCID